MTKSDLIEQLTGKMNLTRKKVESVVNACFDTMFQALVNGDRIEIRGFGRDPRFRQLVRQGLQELRRP